MALTRPIMDNGRSLQDFNWYIISKKFNLSSKVGFLEFVTPRYLILTETILNGKFFLENLGQIHP